MGVDLSLRLSYSDWEKDGGEHMRALVDYAAFRPGTEPADRSGLYRPCGKGLEADVQTLCRMHPDLCRTSAYVRYLSVPDVQGALRFKLEARRRGYEDESGPVCLSAPQGSLPLGHGLFTYDGFAVRPERLQSRLESYRGRMFHLILGLDRRDSELSGLKCASAWADLIRAETPAMALAFHIPLGQFRFFASFHNKETGEDTPHVHVLILSAGPARGYITAAGKEHLREKIEADIGDPGLFRTYVPVQPGEMRARRRELANRARKIRNGLADAPYVPSPEMTRLLRALGPACEVFGKDYPPEERRRFRLLVGRILHELSLDPRVREAYGIWRAFQRELNASAQTGFWPDAAFAVRRDLKKVRLFVTRYARTVAFAMGDDVSLRFAARELFRGVCEELSKPVCVHARSGSYLAQLPPGVRPAEKTVRQAPELRGAAPVLSL